GGAKSLAPAETANDSDPDGADGGATSGTTGGGGTRGAGAATTGQTGAPAGSAGDDGSYLDGVGGGQTDWGDPAVSGDAEVVVAQGDADDPSLAMAAASPQSIPAPTSSAALPLATLGVGAGMLVAAILPPILAQRSGPPRRRLPDQPFSPAGASPDPPRPGTRLP
ncbi:MAG: hypothetical protein LBD70_04365, partial [Bifidobacteriaceae bacterium]|nr:hypothetical protein [Bifidobacteriaceae bacterium]